MGESTGSLTANTGSGWLDKFANVAGTGIQLYNAATGRNQSTAAAPAPAPAPAPAAAPAASSSWQKYAIWGGIGLAVLVVVALVLKKR